jgi:hypothetical protein
MTGAATSCVGFLLMPGDGVSWQVASGKRNKTTLMDKDGAADKK